MKSIVTVAVLTAALDTMPARAQQAAATIDAQTAGRFAAMALACVQKEYPNKITHILNSPGDVRAPHELTPAFYGCYDWHSSVHGHWMLIRLLKTFPGLPETQQIRKALDANLTAENIQAEVAYLKQPNRQSFERTYGWAWLLKLAEELSLWNDSDGRKWSKDLQPLVDAFVE